MKKGKLYIHKGGKMIVMCKSPIFKSSWIFAGVVVEGNKDYSIGDYSEMCVCENVEEYSRNLEEISAKDVRNNSILFQEIDIDIAKGISIRLKGDEYVKFISTLLPELKSEIEQSIKRNEKSISNFKKTRDAMNQMRSIFYDSDDQCALKKEIDEINLEDLDLFLEKYNEEFGFN